MVNTIVEKALEDIKKLMNDVEYSGKNEYRINKNKIGSLRIPLLELYQKGFEQGVYTSTWQGRK